jgi:hypothetical protein
MDFCSLQHIRNRRSTCRGLYLPATFRPQGLVTLSTVFSLRSRAGFVSHQLRSWDLPFGAFSSREAARAFPHGRAHLPFPPASETTYRSRRPGPAGRGFWAYPPGSPWRPAVGLARRPLAAPLGFPLLGSTRDSLDRDFARSPPSRFIVPQSPAIRPASRSLDQPSPASARHLACKHARASGGTLLGFPHRANPNIRIRLVSGYFFTSHRVVHYCRPPDVL